MQNRGTALITGASRGIGLELARVFARQGHGVVLVARNSRALHEAAGQLPGSAIVIPADLADPDSPARIARELNERGIEIEFLVNNAGFGLHGLFAETPLETELRMIQVNVSAITHLTKLFLPQMLARGSGGILNVASTAAFIPGPTTAVYYASKAYVLSFSEALSNELRGSGVISTALCPGPTRTGFQAVAGSSVHGIKKLIALEAPEVAEAGYRGMMRGKRIVIPGAGNRLVTTMARLAPRALSAASVRKAQQKN